MITKNGRHLAEVIKAAIADLKITRAEHEEIINITLNDHVLDSNEKALLRELANMIENKTIKWVP